MNAKVILLIGIGMLISCSPSKRAAKNFKYGKYEAVIDYYKGVLKNRPNDGKANYFVAESYRLSNRIRESEPYYKKAGGKGIDKDSVLLYYAQALKANGKYDEAHAPLQEVETDGETDQLKAIARKEIDGLDYLSRLSQKKSYYKIKNLEAVNTPMSEFGPAYLNSELYFTSSRANAKIYEATGSPYSDLYKATTKGANVDAGTIVPLPETINDPIANEGGITFTPDGKIMVFGKGNTGKKKGGYDVDLYMSRFRNGAWSEATPININTPIKENDPSTTNFSWDSTPAFSPDGRTLYFSSNRKGGYGGDDLYSAQMDSRGRFGKVRNLGPEINTPGDELFPYVADNGKLYFSSDGHPGYGMLDIFVVNRANGKTVVENLGQPVNSSSDDFGIFLFKVDRGFFASNREGGKGDDDIYTFINDDPNLKVVNYYLAGVTYSVGKDSTRRILPDTKVVLYDAKGDVMQDFVTGNDGKFLFRIYENENYNLTGETEGYITKRESYTTLGKSVPVESLKELVTNITLDTVLVLDKLEKRIFRLENIYFGYDSSNIKPAAAKELDKLVDILNDNPEITKIEMGSHTDSVASDAYNLELSQRRAQSTVNYLIRKGISPDRLEARGYGESKPIARNTNRDGTDNPVGRARNRRTEFTILGIGKAQKKPDDLDEDDKYFKNNNN
jgi:peptidoglycan-associated lipoprotein